MMFGTASELGKAFEGAFITVGGFLLAVALAPFLIHLLGILLLSILGAPLWVVAALLLGIH